MRGWREEDLAPFAALNADPAVMEFMPKVLTRAESDAFAERIRTHLAEHGFGLWALELPGVAPFVGFTGLSVVGFDAPFTRAGTRAAPGPEPHASARTFGASRSGAVVEVGWRLARAHWGRGYAPEAARAAIRHGFEGLGLREIVSFTAVGNLRSRRVMEKLGMRHDPADDFDHPALPHGHPLRRHVLYRIRPPTPAR
jgi:RimJ/RimL family protein N-acetyltransferase